MAALKVEYINIDALKPYEGNAKIHTEGQIEQIKKSIQDFGMNDPIAVWGPENVIIEGHGRLIACQELGIDKIPVIRLDGLTDEQRRAYTLVHNKLTMNTGFDIEKMNEEIAGIENIDMSAFGLVINNLDEDFSDFFGDAEKKEKKKKLIQCEHCGQWFEV